MMIFGYGVFAAIFGGMWWVGARRWRYLSGSYAAVAASEPINKRSMQSVVLLGLGGFNTLHGITTIGLHKSGISLRILPPFSLFHAPLFIPFDDIHGWRTSWYLNAKSTELRFQDAPDVQMVMPLELAEWVQSGANGQMQLSENAPSDGNAGQGWRSFLVLTLVLMTTASLYLAYLLLSL